jgi:hypothetical protein
MSTRNLPGGKRRPEPKANNLTASYELIVYNSDSQMAARGPDAARSLIYFGHRQVTGFVPLVKVSISA